MLTDWPALRLKGRTKRNKHPLFLKLLRNTNTNNSLNTIEHVKIAKENERNLVGTFDRKYTINLKTVNRA